MSLLTQIRSWPKSARIAILVIVMLIIGVALFVRLGGEIKKSSKNLEGLNMGEVMGLPDSEDMATMDKFDLTEEELEEMKKLIGEMATSAEEISTSTENEEQ